MTARWPSFLPLWQLFSPEEHTLTERWPDGNVKREVTVAAGDTTEIAVYDEAGRLSKVSRGRMAKTRQMGGFIQTASLGLYTNTTKAFKWAATSPIPTESPSSPAMTHRKPHGMWRFFDDQGGLIREESGPPSTIERE